MTDETNKRIGDYQILDELGSGGMGRVWRVRNVISDRIEAMKVLLPDLAGRQELAARFLREIKLMASLNHPNIAQLRTAFTADNQLYMVMEYVEGTTLAAKLEKGPIPVPDALNYIGQVLSAVSYAHQQHVIHRDIKPANMMLTPQGVIKLMDFGIARAGEDRSLTMTGTTMGSLSYMSPEQVKGEPTDARSDLYSVGVSLVRVRDRAPAVRGYQRLFDHVGTRPRDAQAANRTASRAALGAERHHSHGDCQGPGTTFPDRRRLSQCPEFCAGHPPGDTGDHDRGAGSDYGEHANAVGCEFADGVWGQPQRPRFRAGCGAPGGQDALRYACSSPAASPAERSSRPLHDAGSIDCARRAGRGWNLHASQLQDLCQVARRGNSYT